MGDSYLRDPAKFIMSIPGVDPPDSMEHIPKYSDYFPVESFTDCTQSVDQERSYLNGMSTLHRNDDIIVTISSDVYFRIRSKYGQGIVDSGEIKLCKLWREGDEVEDYYKVELKMYELRGIGSTALSISFDDCKGKVKTKDGGSTPFGFCQSTQKWVT